MSTTSKAIATAANLPAEVKTGDFVAARIREISDLRKQIGKN